MSKRMQPDPIQEPSLGAGPLVTLFEEIEPPAGLEARWRARIALLSAEEAFTNAPAVRPVGVAPRYGPVAGRWSRVAAVATGVAVAAAMVVGVVAANRLTSPGPEPEPSLTITDPPTTSSVPPSPSDSPPPSGAASPVQPGASGQPPRHGPADRGPAPKRPPTPGPAEPPVPPARGPLAEWPDEANTGVPPGTSLRASAGDMHITTPGAVVHDVRVDGTVYVEAPNVTLRRVLVVPRSGAATGVHQRSNASGLRIEDSEISGTGANMKVGIRQEAPMLRVYRSLVRGADTSVLVGSDTTLVDSRLHTVQANGNNARLVVRHNTIDGIALSDEDGPVTDVSIENNRLGTGIGGVIWAPSRPGSQHIRVVDNHFKRGDPVPCHGWNDQAPGNRWTGNVWFGSSEPVNPS